MASVQKNMNEELEKLAIKVRNGEIPPDEVLDHFKNDALNYLIITSPSSIDGILKSLSLLDLSGLKSRIISIGPTTSAAIRKNGGHVFLESENQNINALYENLANLIVGTSLT